MTSPASLACLPSCPSFWTPLTRYGGGYASLGTGGVREWLCSRADAGLQRGVAVFDREFCSNLLRAFATRGRVWKSTAPSLCTKNRFPVYADYVSAMIPNNRNFLSSMIRYCDLFFAIPLCTCTGRVEIAALWKKRIHLLNSIRGSLEPARIILFSKIKLPCHVATRK